MKLVNRVLEKIKEIKTLELIEEKVQVLKWFRGLAPANEHLTPYYKVLKVLGKSVMVVAFNSGASGAQNVATVQVAKAIGGTDLAAVRSLLDHKGWAVLTDGVTFSNGRIVVVDHNGGIRHDQEF
jgi:hypothetical protein